MIFVAELYTSNGTTFTKLPLMTAETTTDVEYNNHTATGFYSVRGVPSTGGTAQVPFSQWGSLISDNSIGTPWQIAIPDGSNPYLYKRATSSNTWSKISAGYADSAGTANAVAWGNISGKPSTYVPSTHTHTKSQITDFPSKLAPYFANNTWYAVGDDCFIGDHNERGGFCIKATSNSVPQIRLYNTDESYYGNVITTKDIGSQSVKHATTADSAINEYSVQVSSTQPTDSRCKIWIKI